MDLDGDGIVDILSGTYSRMDKDMAGTFQVLYGNKDGTFKKAAELTGTDGEPLVIPATEDRLTDKICTRPFAVDYDGDGHLDLVVGNFAGTFFLFKGQGKGKFVPKPEPIKDADGKPLKIPGVHGDPFVVDFDGDGDLDIVSGSSDGGVYWAENTAGKGQPPKFKPFRPLIPPPAAKTEYGAPRREADVTRPTYAARVWVADVTGDGKLDLLVGDSTTLATPAKGLTDAEMKAKQAEWQGAMQAAQEGVSKAEGEEAKAKAREDLNELYRKRAEFVTEEMTGFVWVYVRK